jgi:hypothetical protein
MFSISIGLRASDGLGVNIKQVSLRIKSETCCIDSISQDTGWNCVVFQKAIGDDNIIFLFILLHQKKRTDFGSPALDGIDPGRKKILPRIDTDFHEFVFTVGSPLNSGPPRIPARQ